MVPLSNALRVRERYAQENSVDVESIYVVGRIVLGILQWEVFDCETDEYLTCYAYERDEDEN